MSPFQMPVTMAGLGGKFQVRKQTVTLLDKASLERFWDNQVRLKSILF